MAGLGGTMPWALGTHLWRRLEPKSEIRWWFGLLEPAWKDYMREHYTHFLAVIKVYWLGDVWQQNMNLEFDAQRFRQEGHTRETPQAYIMQRLLYARMLTVTDQGGPLEIHTILKNAPIWRTILVVESIPNTTTLICRVMDHQDALLHAATSSSDHFVTKDDLVSFLKRLNPASNSASFPRSRPDKRFIHHTAANVATQDDDESSEPGDELPSSSNPVETDEVSNESSVPAPLDESTLVSQAFAVIKKRQRPPPKDGYRFQKNDHVATKMGRLIPSPCKVCSSSNHWDKECPDYDAWLQWQKKKSGNMAKAEPSNDIEHVYNQAYDVLMAHRISSVYIDYSKIAEAYASGLFRPSRRLSVKSQNLNQGLRLSESPQLTKMGIGYSVPSPKSSCDLTEFDEGLVSHRVTIEDVEDEFYVKQRKRQFATSCILEQCEPDISGVLPSESSPASTTPPHHVPPVSRPKNAFRATVEEIEDEYHINQRLKPRCEVHLLEEISDTDTSPCVVSYDEAISSDPSTSTWGSGPLLRMA
jgi:hypothetical protein